MNFTLCKNRCNYTIRNKQSRNPTSLRPTLPKPHYPLLCTKLASPRKRGGGLTARHKLSLCCVFTCDMFTFLIYQTFLPSRRRDCHTTIFRLAPTLPKPHYPLPCTNTLASPRKRGGGTADTNFSLAVQYSDSPAFTILKLFRAVTVGIVPRPHHQ